MSTQVSDNIRKLLMQNHKGIVDFAEALGYSPRDAARIICGELLMSPKEIQRIADFFGVTKREIVRGIGYEKNS